MNHPGLHADLEKFIELTMQGRFSELAEYIYPSLFKIVPKKVLVQKMEEAFQGDRMNDLIVAFHIQEISDPVEIKGSLYCKCDYYIRLRADRHVDILDHILKDQPISHAAYEKDRLGQVKYTLKLMKARFGDDAVKYDSRDDCFYIDRFSASLAILDPGAKTWKFIRWGSGSLYQRLFPEDVVKKLATRFYLLD